MSDLQWASVWAVNKYNFCCNINAGYKTHILCLLVEDQAPSLWSRCSNLPQGWQCFDCHSFELVWRVVVVLLVCGCYCSYYRWKKMGTPATVLDASFLISLLRSCWCSQARIDTASLIGSVLFDGFVQKNRPNSQSNNLDEYAPAAASLTLLRQCHAISPSQYFVNTSNISCNTVIQNQSQPTSCRERQKEEEESGFWPY